MASILEKAISILAGNLNSGRSYLITATDIYINKLTPSQRAAGQELNVHLHKNIFIVFFFFFF
jgi:fructose-1,6-bisphosphatase/sedoheptulose 1,7-bisphosphatase-like protein